MANGHGLVIDVSSSRWAFDIGKNCGTCHTCRHIPCSPSSWLASSSTALRLWTLGIAPQRGSHMCLRGFPSWCILLPREWHILGVAWSSLSCRAYRRKVHSELFSAKVFELLSYPRAARQSSSTLRWVPSMMVLVLIPLPSIVGGYWVQPRTPQRLHPVGLHPLSKPALLIHQRLNFCFVWWPHWKRQRINSATPLPCLGRRPSFLLSLGRYHLPDSPPVESR